MKLIALALIAILIGIGAAEKTYNLTESELLEIIDTAWMAGSQSAFGSVQKLIYNSGAGNYPDYYTSIVNANAAIRLYNLMLKEHFNDTIVAQHIKDEFSL